MENKTQIVVIQDKDDYGTANDDILFVLEITNYDNADNFNIAVRSGRDIFEQQEADCFW